MSHTIRRPRSYPALLRQRQLGLTNKRPPLTPFFGGFRTSRNDEYGFWTPNCDNRPTAVPPFALAFSTSALNGHALLTSDEAGVVTVIDTRRSLRNQMLVAWPSHAPPTRFRGHDNAIFDVSWLPGDARVVTASGDTSARVFDVETTMRLALLRGHQKSVKAVRPLPSNPSLLATGSRDGAVRFFDLRTPGIYNPAEANSLFHLPVLEINAAHKPPPVARKRSRVRPEVPPASITSLAFQPASDNLLFTAGAGDGRIKLWDVRGVERSRGKRVPAACVASATPGLEPRVGRDEGSRRQHGISSLDIDSTGRYVAASATDSTIYLYEARDLSLGVSKRLVGHAQTSFYIKSKFSPCGRYVLSGSADSCAYMWDVERYGVEGQIEPDLCLVGHQGGEVSAVTWCAADRFKIGTSGDDATVKVWHVEKGKRALGKVERGDNSVNGACKMSAFGHEKRGRKRREGRIEGRVVKFGVRRRKLVDADIRNYFGASAIGDSARGVRVGGTAKDNVEGDFMSLL